MKQLDLITARREGTWMIYQLKEPGNGLLQANLYYLVRAEREACNNRKPSPGSRSTGPAPE